jgi:hypothetical protein
MPIMTDTDVARETARLAIAAEEYVLTSYRLLRKTCKKAPFWAMHEIGGWAADSYLTGALLGLPPDAPCQLKDLERVRAARAYGALIGERGDAEMARRGVARYATFWHTGQVGGA